MTDLDDDNLKYAEGEKPQSAEENEHSREISADLIRGHINTIILRTLTDGEKYGTEIIDEIERKSCGQYSMKQPTLYSALKRLESQGFVTSYWGGVSSGGRRRYFNLTSLGREEAEKNIDEWEYSRTIIDSLISSKYVDFSSEDEGENDGYEEKNSPSDPPSDGEEMDKNDENIYSALSPYLLHADEFSSAPTNCAEVEVPIDIQSKEEIECEEPIPEEPVYDFDGAADFSCENFPPPEEAELAPENEVVLPKDTERIYITVPEDTPFIDEDADGKTAAFSLKSEEITEPTNIIFDDGASFKSGDAPLSESEEEKSEALAADDEENPSLDDAKTEGDEENARTADSAEPLKPTEEEKSEEEEKEGEKEETASQKAEEKAEEPPAKESAESTLSTSDYRQIVRRSQIDRDFRKTLDRIYASAYIDGAKATEETRYNNEDGESRRGDVPYYEREEEREDAERDEAAASGEYKKILEENPEIRQESEDSYMIAGYQSRELFDENYADVKRVDINGKSAADGAEEDEESPSSKRENADESNYTPLGWTMGRAEAQRSEYATEEEDKSSDERPFIQLPEDTSMPERENVSFTPGLIDVSDIMAEAKADGIKISITCGTRKFAAVERDSGTVSYVKPLARVKAALTVFIIALIESIIVFANMTYMQVNAVYPIFMLTIPLVYLAVCAAVYIRKGAVKEKQSNSSRGITAASVAFMICILAICAVSIAAGIKLDDGGKIVSYLVMPSIYSLNIIIYAVAFYGFSKR